MQGVADRVLLGLLPSSREGWPVALAALKPSTGGWLHLHHNVKDSEEAAWMASTQVCTCHSPGAVLFGFLLKFEFSSMPTLLTAVKLGASSVDGMPSWRHTLVFDTRYLAMMAQEKVCWFHQKCCTLISHSSLCAWYADMSSIDELRDGRYAGGAGDAVPGAWQKLARSDSACGASQVVCTAHAPPGPGRGVPARSGSRHISHQ